MTDQSYVLEVLKENADQNFGEDSKLRQKIVTGELVWGTPEHLAEYKDTAWDFLVGSDLIYAKEGIKPLVDTFEYLSQFAHPVTKAHSVVFMAIIRRFEWEQLFFDLMSHNFVQTKVVSAVLFIFFIFLFFF
ncbi:hypothetical protein RFI_13661 [Reticulomyxa filosa]|uniref:Uncharacterized protein n=1 Tax=Reticulomyxa filosa TaxID=46433 RepID=X6NCM8_RETFI|nr:hypothetical protein RFI_13661 [Reticulomyxa filosa]|eukprot:ETO23519.1 hypothetical protein RFI_13661 [Reticulomyxa filosa]